MPCRRGRGRGPTGLLPPPPPFFIALCACFTAVRGVGKASAPPMCACWVVLLASERRSVSVAQRRRRCVAALTSVGALYSSRRHCLLCRFGDDATGGAAPPPHHLAKYNLPKYFGVEYDACMYGFGELAAVVGACRIRIPCSCFSACTRHARTPLSQQASLGPLGHDAFFAHGRPPRHAAARRLAARAAPILSVDGFCCRNVTIVNVKRLCADAKQRAHAHLHVTGGWVADAASAAAAPTAVNHTQPSSCTPSVMGCAGQTRQPQAYDKP